MPKTQDQLNFEKGYRELRAKLVAMGMFNARYIQACLMQCHTKGHFGSLTAFVVSIAATRTTCGRW